MRRFLYTGVAIFFLKFSNLYAAMEQERIKSTDIGFGRTGRLPDGSLLTTNTNTTFINVLTMIQSFLLKVVLPVVVVGAGLYIAYELFLAEGDETKLKRAWRSVLYTAIGLIAIAISYAFVSMVARISI